MVIEKAAKRFFENYLRVSDGDVLIITDVKLSIAYAIENAAKKLGIRSKVMKIKKLSHISDEPPEKVAKSMLENDYVIAPMCTSLTHTDATKRAIENGVFVITMPNITERIFVNGSLSNFDEMRKIADKLSSYIKKSRKIKIFSGAGGYIEAKIMKNAGMVDVLPEKPSVYNFPSGEVAIVPEDGAGEIYIDLTAPERVIKEIERPIRIVIRDGRLFYAENSQLLESIDNADKNARNFAEIGIGINRSLKHEYNVLNDEKLFGTAHIAFGDSHVLGGDVVSKIHYDLVFTLEKVFIGHNIFSPNTLDISQVS